MPQALSREQLGHPYLATFLLATLSHPESIREVEKYQVDLSGVTVFELVINPDISGGSARASLKNLRLS